MGQFKITQTGLDGLLIIESEVRTDERGYFMETYNARDLKSAGLSLNFVQDNHSHSIKGVLRGLHFQKKHPQGKLVRVVAGSIYDVAVDLRPASPSFKRWFGVVLSSVNQKQLYIPRGFAHGFLALSEAEVIYKCTDYYDPEDEDGIIWNDPEIGIEWPEHDQIVISAKDARLGNFEEDRCAIDCLY
ncbi:MAG TPA: dTDP-4-dehydrorhamnose 3,5-epimerase [Bacillota bacterium]